MTGLLAALVWTTALQAATVTTRNFVVHAESDDVARQVAETAEECRRELAVAWLGKELPPWYRRCPIKVKVGQIGAGGATTFTFEGGEVFGWNMNVQGSLERVLDSVIPHEVSHTIFASHFRRPLPRWADEGAATLVEHESERLRQTKLLNQVLRTSRRIPLQQLLEITEYPQDMQQVLTLYAEGYSLADFLVQQKGEQGRTTYLAFLNDAHHHNWSYAFRKHYGYKAVQDVERDWHEWVIAGSPELPARDGTLVASTENSSGRSKPAAATTSQSREPQPAAAPVSAALAAAEPLAPIQRSLRSRIAGGQLDAPEPSVTAMPARDIEAPRRDPVAESIPLNAGQSNGRAEASESDATVSDPSPRRPRPRPIFGGGESLRSVNAGRDDAFQR